MSHDPFSNDDPDTLPSWQESDFAALATAYQSLKKSAPAAVQSRKKRLSQATEDPLPTDFHQVAATATGTPIALAPTDLRQVKSALAFVSLKSHSNWRSIGMAIHDYTRGSKEGLELWNAWSKERMAGAYDEAEQIREWASFKEEPLRARGETLLAKVQQNGWAEDNDGSLPSSAHTPIRFSEDGMELAAATITAVRKRFTAYKSHQPSEAEWDGLKQIAILINAMAIDADGKAAGKKGRIGLSPNFFLSALSPGTGKTAVVQEAIRELCTNPKYDQIGVIVFLSRLDEISRYAENCKLSDDDFAVIVSHGKSENELGRQGDKTGAKVLFTTQEGLRARAKNGSLFRDVDGLFFQGKPRQVRIWDEAILPFRALLVSRNDVSDMLKPLREAGKIELANELEAFFIKLKSTADQGVITVPDLTKHEDFDGIKSLFPDDRLESVGSIWKLSGHRVRIRLGKFDGPVALSHEDALPEDLGPMLVLDASGGFRQTYEFWHECRKGLEFLPSARKGYSGLTIHHWNRGSGKSAYNRDHLNIAQGIAKTINSEIPKDEPVLVVHFAPNRFIPDIEAPILEYVDRDRLVKFLTWGKHTATNDFHQFMSGVSTSETELA